MENNSSEKSKKRYPSLSEVSFQVFINPVITKASSDRVRFWHGCLSAKGKKYGELASYTWLKYEALDSSLQTMRGSLDGLAAVIFQHEFICWMYER